MGDSDSFSWEFFSFGIVYKKILEEVATRHMSAVHSFRILQIGYLAPSAGAMFTLMSKAYVLLRVCLSTWKLIQQHGSSYSALPLHNCAHTNMLVGEALRAKRRAFKKQPSSAEY